jgi:hypothetical protein
MVTDIGLLVARGAGECMTDREIRYEETIVWSVDELRAAVAMTQRHRSTLRSGRTTTSAEPPDPTEFIQSIEAWFDTRYHSHASMVADVHFIRFMKILYFMMVHRDELERRGYPLGGWGDEHLLRALVAIRCSPKLGLDPAGELSAPIDLDDVLFVRAALESGTREVREFERLPWDRDPDGDEDDRSCDEGWFLNPGRLLRALVVLDTFADLPPVQQALCEVELRRDLSPRTGRELAGETDLRFVILAWLIDEIGQNPRAARRTVDWIFAIDRFLRAHGPQLVADGLATWGRRIYWKPVLIEALAYIDPSELMTGSELPPREYQGIVAGARALESYRANIRREKSGTGRSG